jgi:hypothetical protein
VQLASGTRKAFYSTVAAAQAARFANQVRQSAEAGAGVGAASLLEAVVMSDVPTAARLRAPNSATIRCM